jgi:hypothetical protein
VKLPCENEEYFYRKMVWAELGLMRENEGQPLPLAPGRESSEKILKIKTEKRTKI